MLRSLLVVSVGLTLLGCNSESKIEPSAVQQSTVVNQMKVSPKIVPPLGTAFVGKVIYVKLEGGFWAVITDSGQKLNGMIPTNLRIDNQKVSGIYVERKNEMSFRMWGILVNFSELTAIGKSKPITSNPQA